MKLNSQIKMLISFLLLFAVTTSAGIFLRTQYSEKKELISDMIMQKNRFLERLAVTSPSRNVRDVLSAELRVPEWSRSMVVGKDGKVLFQEPLSLRYRDENFINSRNLKEALASGAGEGLVLEKGSQGGVFLGFKIVPGIGFILSVAPTSLVQSSMLYQSLVVILSSIAILALGLVVFSFVLNRLTGGLEALSSRVKSFGAGQLNSRIEEELGSKEIDTLAKNFNLMAKSIEDLILVKEKKSSIDAEIRMAEQVQMSFFPEMNVTSREYSLTAFTQQMLGCGGDWVYHFRSGSSLFVAVGDVTGHGLSSALLTGVSRTFFSVVEDNDGIQPAELLEKLNKVLYKVAKGSLTMTFFLARIDLKTGEVEYSNASHCTPFVYNIAAKNSLLLGDPGPILGRQLISKYQNEKIQLKPNDTLFLYTDGLVELKTAQGKHLGERKLLKTMSDFIAKESFETLTPKLSSYVRQTRGTQELEDDLSWLILRFNEYSA